ncbi:hypothetical protein VXQ47_17800 [Acinetobacter pittii]|uniref:hypothetical protein n=1 Tax=Acinetobacter pittii TaxID=48296 RepID=UPI003A8ABB55
MNLQEMISNIEYLSDEQTIYVEQPWNISSNTIAQSDDEMIEVYIDGKHYAYFLEVFIIRELITDLDDSLNIEDLIQRIIKYAVDDV